MIRLVATLLLGCVLLLGARFPASAQIRLDLRDVDLRSYIQLVSEQTRRNFLIDPEIEGTVSVFAPVPVSPAAMYEIFLNVLELNGLTIVEGEDIDRIVPVGTAAGLAPGIRGVRNGGAFETRVIPVDSNDIDSILEVVDPLVSPQAVVSALPSAGIIVLSDRSENIGRIESLMQRLSTVSDRAVEAVRLNHASAGDLVTVLQSAAPPGTGASLAADPGANTIIVSGPAEYRNRIRAIVSELDRPQQVRTVSRVVRLNYARATELAEVVSQSLGTPGEGEAQQVTVVAEPQSNAILITAPAERAEAIAQAVRTLDVRPSQVLVEAVIFEISAENFSDLAVQFGGLLNDAIGGGTSFSLNGRASLITLVSAAMAGQTVNPGDGGVLGFSDGNFSALVTAIAREDSTRLLSTPAVLTLNNQEAEIVVAQNVPFVTGQYSTVGDSAVPEQPFQTIERQDVGLTLTVRPQITEHGVVRMSIMQEVSNLTGTTAAAGGEVTARRRLSTNALVGSGEVIILGGLIEDNTTQRNHRVPGLSNLPVLGNLFRGRSVQEGQRVLLIMLRPRVVESDREAARLTRELARESEQLSRQISPRQNVGLFPQVRRTGFPFDGIDLNQPFDETYVDRAVRDRLFPALPPRLMVDVGQ